MPALFHYLLSFIVRSFHLLSIQIFYIFYLLATIKHKQLNLNNKGKNKNKTTTQMKANERFLSCFDIPLGVQIKACENKFTNNKHIRALLWAISTADDFFNQWPQLQQQAPR